MELLGAITFAFGVAAELRRDSVTAHAAEYYSQMELHSNGTSSRNSRSENTDYYARQGDEGNPSLYVLLVSLVHVAQCMGFRGPTCRF